jgi:hypothetical protein
VLRQFSLQQPVRIVQAPAWLKADACLQVAKELLDRGLIGLRYNSVQVRTRDQLIVGENGVYTFHAELTLLGRQFLAFITEPTAGALSFTLASVTMTTSTQDRLTLNLAAPAPAAGLTVNLSSTNPGVANVPATVTIPANSTSVIVPVTGVAAGSTSIHASALPNVPDTIISVTVI